MTTIEAGKEAVEKLIMKIASEATPPVAVSSLVWWSIGDGTDKARMPLRVYRGNSWRSMDFLQSDIDGCAAAPEVLAKYEGEIAQILGEL